MADIIKQQVKKFLKDKSMKEIRIKYPGPRMNAGYEWWRLRNPIRMLWTSLIIEITRMMPPLALKNSLLRMVGMKIGKDVTISPKVNFDWLFPECIEIEDGAFLGADIVIAVHSITIDEIRLGRVNIGKQALIASWVCNEPPTTFGARSITGLFSYVNKDVPDDNFVVGIPAKPKKDLKEINYLEEFNKKLKRK